MPVCSPHDVKGTTIGCQGNNTEGRPCEPMCTITVSHWPDLGKDPSAGRKPSPTTCERTVILDKVLNAKPLFHRWKIVRRVESVHVIAISKPWISREMVGNCVCGLLLSTCSPGWANPSSGSRPSQVRASPWSQQAWKTSLKRNSELGLATSLWSHWRTTVVGVRSRAWG